MKLNVRMSLKPDSMIRIKQSAVTTETSKGRTHNNYIDARETLTQARGDADFPRRDLTGST